MVRVVALIALAGCGRFGFDAAAGSSSGDANDASDGPISDVVPPGHDEDGDGVPDSDDVCPHVADALQLDDDGDGVGNACDPDPTVANQIALFATMGPGDQPFTIGALTDYVITQLPDAVRFDGELGADGNIYANLQIPITLADARVAVGFDVIAIVPGANSGQNQIALALLDQPPSYYVELNRIEGQYELAAITHFDGSNYVQAEMRDLATGIHAGYLVLQTTQRVGSGVAFEAGWPDEIYTMSVNDAVYQGATRIEMNMNNVHFEIRWLVVITPQ